MEKDASNRIIHYAVLSFIEKNLPDKWAALQTTVIECAKLGRDIDKELQRLKVLKKPLDDKLDAELQKEPPSETEINALLAELKPIDDSEIKAYEKMESHFKMQEMEMNRQFNFLKSVNKHKKLPAFLAGLQKEYPAVSAVSVYQAIPSIILNEMQNLRQTINPMPDLSDEQREVVGRWTGLVTQQLTEGSGRKLH